MSRRKLKNKGYFFSCTHSTHDKDTECNINDRYSESWLESMAFRAIRHYVALAEKQAVQEREVGGLRKSAIRECADKLKLLQGQLEQLKSAKLRLYEKYTAEIISKTDYLRQKAEVDKKLSETEEAIRLAHDRMHELDSEQSCSDERISDVCDRYDGDKGLTYELAHALISAIYVHDQDNIEIVWKFKDFLNPSKGEVR